MVKKLPGWPEGKKIAFAIRDDDLSYFTKPEILDALYSYAWEKRFKVSFGAVSNIKGTNSQQIPPEYRGNGKEYPIYENKELVEFINSKIEEEKLDIVLHAYNHTDNVNLPIHQDGKMIPPNEFYSEFYNKNIKEISNRIIKAKKIVENTFNMKMIVFVLPQGFLNDNIWQALNKNKLAVCVGANVKHYIQQIKISNIRFWLIPYLVYLKLARREIKYFWNKAQKTSFRISKVPMIFNSHAFYWSRYSTPKEAKKNFKAFKEYFEEIKISNGYFIIATHHCLFFRDWEKKITQKNHKEYFDKILDYVDQSSDVWKCSLSELVRHISSYQNSAMPVFD